MIQLNVIRVFILMEVSVNNEEIVGEAVKDFRDDIVLCTKFGVTHKGDHLRIRQFTTED